MRKRLESNSFRVYVSLLFPIRSS